MTWERKENNTLTNDKKAYSAGKKDVLAIENVLLEILNSVEEVKDKGKEISQKLK